MSLQEGDPDKKWALDIAKGEVDREKRLKAAIRSFYAREGITNQTLQDVDTTDIEDIARKLSPGFIDRFLSDPDIQNNLRPQVDDED